MCPEQYIAGFLNSNGGTTQSTKPCLPLRVIVPNTPRWSGKSKPKVKPGTYAAVSGYLSAIERDAATSQVIRFAIDLGSIVFFGKASYVAGNTSNTLDNPPGMSLAFHRYNIITDTGPNISRFTSNEEREASI